MQCSLVYGVFDCLFLAVYKWSIAGTISKNISEPSYIYGLVALVCFDMLGIFSIQFVRSRCYNLFFATHAVGLIVLLFSVSVFFTFIIATRPCCLY
jgi:hypothetical protein